MGAADPAKFIDVFREDVEKGLFEIDISGPDQKASNIRYTLIIIVISGHYLCDYYCHL